jgi:hypothetical protein
MLKPLNALPRQCAWCWLVMDTTGVYSIQAGRKISSATHGICPMCKAVVRAEIERTSSILFRAA